MPIFEYLCPRGHTFDKIVPIAQMDDYQECPGKLVEIPEDADPIKLGLFGVITGDGKPVVVPCRAPAKRIPVPSRPAHIIIH